MIFVIIIIFTEASTKNGPTNFVGLASSTPREHMMPRLFWHFVVRRSSAEFPNGALDALLAPARPVAMDRRRRLPKGDMRCQERRVRGAPTKATPHPGEALMECQGSWAASTLTASAGAWSLSRGCDGVAVEGNGTGRTGMAVEGVRW